MRFKVRPALFFLILVISFHSKATDVIFDTDMAIDDWSALLLLANHPEINLLAVTANGAGETHCDPAMKNIASLLDLTRLKSNSQLPIIACGDDYPLDGHFVFPGPWREQADTLSGVAVPASARPISDKHAVEVIHNSVAENKNPVVLLTTGSLTNIAQWLEIYPQDKSKIARMVIMGGSFFTKGNIIVPGFTDEHPNTKAEWNIYVDALAAAKVFESGLPIEVVGLDVTNKVRVTTEFAQGFKAKVASPASEFWDKVLDDNDWFIDSGEYYFWDVLAALVVIDEKFCIGDKYSAYVSADHSESAGVWDDTSFPELNYKDQPRNHFNPKTTGITHVGGDNPSVKICTETDAKKAFTLFTKTLNRK